MFVKGEYSTEDVLKLRCDPLCHSKAEHLTNMKVTESPSEKVQGSAPLGATGPRASERVSEREGFQRFSEVFRGSQRVFRRFSEIFLRFSEALSETLFPLRGSQSCCP